MLDKRLLRENPTLIAEGLKRRGSNFDLSPLKLKSQKLRDIETSRSNLQAKGNAIGKDVGQKIKAGINPQGEEISKLRSKGNEIKKNVS